MNEIWAKIKHEQHVCRTEKELHVAYVVVRAFKSIIEAGLGTLSSRKSGASTLVTDALQVRARFAGAYCASAVDVEAGEVFKGNTLVVTHEAFAGYLVPGAKDKKSSKYWARLPPLQISSSDEAYIHTTDALLSRIQECRGQGLPVLRPVRG